LDRLLPSRRAQRVPSPPRPAGPAVPGAAEIAPRRHGRSRRGTECPGDFRRRATSLRFGPAALAVGAVRQLGPQTAPDGRESAAGAQSSAPSLSAVAGGASRGRWRAGERGRDLVAFTAAGPGRGGGTLVSRSRVVRAPDVRGAAGRGDGHPAASKAICCAPTPCCTWKKSCGAKRW
jgi:hypothetical protein